MGGIMRYMIVLLVLIAGCSTGEIVAEPKTKSENIVLAQQQRLISTMYEEIESKVDFQPTRECKDFVCFYRGVESNEAVSFNGKRAYSYGGATYEVVEEMFFEEIAEGEFAFKSIIRDGEIYYTDEQLNGQRRRKHKELTDTELRALLRKDFNHEAREKKFKDDAVLCTFQTNDYATFVELVKSWKRGFPGTVTSWLKQEECFEFKAS